MTCPNCGELLKPNRYCGRCQRVIRPTRTQAELAHYLQARPDCQCLICRRIRRERVSR